MRDITNHSDKELSLIIFNDNYFYREINNLSYLKALINEEFVYTAEQLEVAMLDVIDYNNEV